MKNLIISTVILFMSLTAVAQDNFAKFEDMQDVSAMVMNQKMFKMLGKIDLDSKDPEMQSYIKMVNSLDNIEVYSTKSNLAAKQMKGEFDNYLNSANLEELMRVKDDGKNVKFFYKPGKSDDFVSQFLMFMDGTSGDDDTVIIKITGDISLKDIGKIASTINFSGSEELKNLKTNH